LGKVWIKEMSSGSWARIEAAIREGEKKREFID
jgi:hypothetical protein